MLKTTNILRRQFKPFKSFTRHVSYDFSQYLANLPATRYLKLPNGVTIATEVRDSCKASIGLFIEAGSRYESPSDNGIAHFFEHIAFKGTKTQNRTTLETQMAGIGAKFKCHVGRELAVYYVECLSQNAQLATEILTECVFENAFNEKEIESQKVVVYEEMLKHDKNPRKVVKDYLHATAFQGTPLAQTVMGPTSNLSGFKADSISKYLHMFYSPCRTVLAAVGGVTHEQMVSVADFNIGSLKSRKSPDLEPYRYTGSEVRYRDDSMPTAHVVFAVEGPAFSDNDRIVMEVARFLLGGWDRSQPGGEMHPLRVAREASCCGLCDSYQTFNLAYKDCGLFGVHFVSGVMHLDDMMMLIQDELMYLCLSVTESEVQRAKNFLKTKILSQMESELGTCMDIGKWTLYRGSRPTLQNQIHAVERITVSHVRDTCYRYLYNKCPVVAAIGPLEGLLEYGRIRGSMWSLKT